ncbi:hypothetical protein Taro_056169 [Colocasia esculenta]|uniref:Uncharacterized protein n=1 Tax=Colocasia esculenta TaxID=4460 RepID=A0A843XWI1_COLES|nr:hypothetical protein [Colocasia esculenta]
MRPFTDRVEVPILNWGLAGGSDPRANKYLRPTGGGVRMLTHRQPATAFPERKLGAGPEISECNRLPTGSKCRF